uniref:Uncharacterized protein n=1 Tax=Oryza sativa subsp. indica TaxID=39946 RepID=A0A679B9L2_ORYSI|nr:hypothetical protein [Oryza sativa Indica Group]
MGYCMMNFMLMEPLPERREGGHPQKTMTIQWREAILGITMDVVGLPGPNGLVRINTEDFRFPKSGVYRAGIRAYRL